jgi:aminomethyltransferase
VGFHVTEPKLVARHGFAVSLDGKPVDIVRSGTITPTVGAAIGTTYLPRAQAVPGTKIAIDVRGRPASAEVVRMPFIPHRTKR